MLFTLFAASLFSVTVLASSKGKAGKIQTASIDQPVFELHRFNNEDHSYTDIQRAVTVISLLERTTVPIFEYNLVEQISGPNKKYMKLLKNAGKKVNEGTLDYEAIKAAMHHHKDTLLKLCSKYTIGETIASFVRILADSFTGEANVALNAMSDQVPSFSSEPFNGATIFMESIITGEKDRKWLFILPESDTDSHRPLPTTAVVKGEETGRVAEYRIDTVVLESTMRELVVVLRRRPDGMWYFDNPKFHCLSTPNFLAHQLMSTGKRTLRYAVLLFELVEN